MSIAVLTQVYAEARRLAIAGSVVARGDFRLKKLLPPLEAAGKQAPVFAKVAEAATKVVDGPESSSAEALLELTSLVNAVLYTQGETGLAGKLEAVETTDLGGSIAQTSARVLKPLLEALSSTGSGRLELVKDAHEQGLFRDLRLVKPALAALDDPYPEVAELIAEKVLPLYGKAILPELRAKYDPKGTKGHPRRLTLMHALDPAGTKERVKAALDGGSKEVKVAAVACLGADDLSFLLEQAAAKAQDVRAAAYTALAKIDKPEAVAVLAKALKGKDAHAVADVIETSKSAKLVEAMADETRASVDEVVKLKDKKKVGESIYRTNYFLRSLPPAASRATETLLLDLFARRAEFAKLKGTNVSGSDLNEAVAGAMARLSPATQTALIDARDELTDEEFGMAFEAARLARSPAEVYGLFAPYLTARVDDKKKSKDPAWRRREAVCDAIESGYNRYRWDVDEDEDDDDMKPREYDPRWLDLAVTLERAGLVDELARPGHAGALAFVKKAFDAALKKAKTPYDLSSEVAMMARLRHPGATDALLAAMAKRGKKTPAYHHYWAARLVPRLPKDAIPRLEEFAATLPENEADDWLEAIQQLRTKA